MEVAVPHGAVHSLQNLFQGLQKDPLLQNHRHPTVCQQLLSNHKYGNNPDLAFSMKTFSSQITTNTSLALSHSTRPLNVENGVRKWCCDVVGDAGCRIHVVRHMYILNETMQLPKKVSSRPRGLLQIERALQRYLPYRERGI